MSYDAILHTALRAVLQQCFWHILDQAVSIEGSLIIVCCAAVLTEKEKYQVTSD